MLHMLPVLPTMEFVTAPVPFVVTEFVTLDWLSRMTEPVPCDEVLEVTELELPLETSLDTVW